MYGGMNKQHLLAAPSDPQAWQQALYAFLAEKHRRSGSERTVAAYSRMLQQFFGRLGKTPENVTPPDVLFYAHGIGLSGKTPSSVTVGARLACVSSFFKFLIRMGSSHRTPATRLNAPGRNRRLPVASPPTRCARCSPWSRRPSTDAGTGPFS